jgi:hypothetical protein
MKFSIESLNVELMLYPTYDNKFDARDLIGIDIILDSDIEDLKKKVMDRVRALKIKAYLLSNLGFKEFDVWNFSEFNPSVEFEGKGMLSKLHDSKNDVYL